MIKFKGFVVAKDGMYYKNEREFVEDLQKAKEFNSKGTAKKVAKKCNGTVRELVY